jgi:antitoxin component YwqK of YwqJK toxin-antitoxin module
MRIWATGLIVLISGHIFGQRSFTDFVRETDSLNIYYFKTLKPSGRLDPNGNKTALWVEYELSFDSANSTIPVTVKRSDVSYDMELPNPSKLTKKEGNFSGGEMTGQFKFYTANYQDDGSVIWEINRETEYVGGKRNGLEREFDHFGTPYHEASYLDDRLHGTETIYMPPGTLFLNATYTEGAAQSATWYFDNGQIEKTKDYTKYPIVTVVEYHRNRKVKATYIVRGEEEQLDGVYEEFDQNGRRLSRKTYERGIEVKK